MWYRVLVFTPRVTEGSAYDPSPSAFPAFLSSILESFRFEDEGDYEYEIISILSIVRARVSFILEGKRDSRRHSTTGFSKNVLVVGTSYHMLEMLSLCDRERA